MDILKRLFGLEPAAPAPEPEGPETRTVALIVEKLDALDTRRARHVAAFAYVLGRVAHADSHISDVETRKMEQIVTRLGHLPAEQASLVVEMARNQTQLFGSTEDFLVTREFAKISDRTQREELLDCLFAVSAADDSISSVEESQIRQIADELGFTHLEYIAVRAAYNDKRDVLKDLPGT